MTGTKIKHFCKCGEEKPPESKHCKECSKLKRISIKAQKEFYTRQTQNMYKMSDEIEYKLEKLQKKRLKK